MIRGETKGGRPKVAFRAPPDKAFFDPIGSENRPIDLFQRIIFVRQVCNLAG